MPTPIYYAPTDNALQKQINANFTSGGTVITLNNTTGVQNKPGICVVNRVDTNGNALASNLRTYYSFTGTSGATLTGVVAVDGTDQDHAIGEVVEFVPDITWANAVAEALATVVNSSDVSQTATAIVTLTGSQTLTNKILTSPSITTPSVTSGDVNLATGLNIQVNGADPYRSIVIPAGSMSPTTTAGCAAIATVEAGTNDVDYKVLDFDTTTVESAWVLFQMPNSWDGGTITFQAIWTAASGSGNVVFGLKGRAYANDDAIDQAYGTEQTVDDTLITAGDVHISPESSAITLAGTPAGGQMVQFKITRQTGSDNLGVDARLIGIRIKYKVGQYSD